MYINIIFMILIKYLKSYACGVVCLSMNFISFKQFKPFSDNEDYFAKQTTYKSVY